MGSPVRAIGISQFVPGKVWPNRVHTVQYIDNGGRLSTAIVPPRYVEDECQSLDSAVQGRCEIAPRGFKHNGFDRERGARGTLGMRREDPAGEG